MPLLSALSAATVLRTVRTQRCFRSSPSTPLTSSLAPRHLLSIADVTPSELTTLVRNARSYKHAIKSGSIPKNLLGSLTGKTIAMIFNKRSTRTRVSTEGAVVSMGGHPMFLGKDDIQLNVGHIYIYVRSITHNIMFLSIRLAYHRTRGGLSLCACLLVFQCSDNLSAQSTKSIPRLTNPSTTRLLSCLLWCLASLRGLGHTPT
jgi:ornithine carbamoyltransferase